MDGEAGWWTTSGNIGLPPLARAMGVGRQQQQQQHSDLPTPNDTAYKRWNCHSGLKLLCKLCRTSPPMGARFTVFWACRPCGPAGRLALLLTKAGDVETNPGLTTLNKKVWICDICHKQIHVRKQISITPPLPTQVQAPYPLPTYTTHTTATKTQTHVQHSR